MIFCVFIFIFRLEPTAREQVDENEFRRCYGVFFESTILKLLGQAMFKVQTITRHFDNGNLKRYITVENFTDMDHHMKKFFLE